MKLFGFLICFVFALSIVSAGVQICIDLDAPSPPANLGVSGSVGSILLKWDAAIDAPACSGIYEYVISREGSEIGRVLGNVLSFVDNASLVNGEYTYTVYAVDLVGHNAGSAIGNVVNVGGGGGTSGGSSSSSYTCVENWTCEDWSECVGNDMRRICSDVNECGTNQTKPDVYQECGISSSGSDDNMTLEVGDVGPSGSSPVARAFSAITGAVVGVAGTPEGVAVVAFMVLVLSGFIAIRIRKKGLSQ